MKHYQGIDYGFRPESYWADNDPLQAILRNVKGESRRQMICDYAAEHRLEELDTELLRDEVDEVTRKRMGSIHPSFMGGEYLPGYLLGEVEIARICLRSTTADVITVRARPTANGQIAYRVEDEYEARFKLPFNTSKYPLTLANLIQLLDDGTLDDSGFPDGGLSLGYNNLNVEYSGHQELRDFTRIESNFYRNLEKHYDHVFNEWVAVGLAETNEEPKP